MIYTPTMITLNEASGLTRIPPRPEEHRQPNYLDQFDFLTIASDIVISHGRVWLVCPPFLNLEEPLKSSIFKWNQTDVTSFVKFENFNRMSRASFPTSSHQGVLEISGPLGNWTINVTEPTTEILRDQRVIVTQQQNNRLEWIAYWALFNVKVNGATSIVIYDNKSTAYSLSDLDSLLSNIPGLTSWIVIDWQTPYGITGGPANMWDSDFGQYVSWEHARRSFATDASSVMIIDIDELPITTERDNIFTQIEKSEAKSLNFGRQPIRAFNNRATDSNQLRVHSDYSLGESKGAWLMGKYVYVPSRLEDSDQLKVHLLESKGSMPLKNPSTFAGHFDGIRIRWRLGQKEPVPNYRSQDEIKEDVNPVLIFEDAFDGLQADWVNLLTRISELLERQSTETGD